MGLPFRTYNRESPNSALGQVGDLECDVCRVFTMVVLVGGETLPSTGKVYIQGSLDGVTWIDLGFVSIVNTATVFAVTTDSNPHYMRFVRGRMDGISGGAYEEITAYIAPAN